MNAIDSSAWLEYFANGPNARFFAPPIEDNAHAIVPTLTLCEVFKRVLQQRTESEAPQAAATMQQGTVVDLNASIAISAAKISLELGIPMADSVILATARAYETTQWTQDEDFKGLGGVKYRRRKP